MSESSPEPSARMEEYVRETANCRFAVNVRDFPSGRAILATSPAERAWFLLEAWRLNRQAGRGGTHPHASGAALLALATRLLSSRLSCTPDQMQRIIWEADLDEMKGGLLGNIERHLEEWGMTPDVERMLRIKREELARRARSKADKARLERVEELLHYEEMLIPLDEDT